MNANQGTQLQMTLGVQVGQEVRITGKRGCYRVIGLRPGGAVQLIDEDQKWHVVRPEAVRAVPPPGRRPRSRIR